MKRTLTGLVSGLFLTAAAAFGVSIPLAPGTGTPVLTDNGALPAGAPLYTTTLLLTNAGNPAQTATVVEDVFQGTLGLDFFYQVTNTSKTTGNHVADPFNEVAVDFFTGYTTAVAYDTNGCTPGSAVGDCAIPQNAPGANLASRSGGGDTVNFFFTLTGADGQLAVGQTSAWLEVDTNAPAVDNMGEASVIDGGTAININALEPAGTVPEPLTLGLLGGGLAFVGLARLRKNRKA